MLEAKNGHDFLEQMKELPGEKYPQVVLIDLLKEMVTGKNYKSIGEKLFISPLTVRKHTANIYEKLHVNSRAQIINLAYKNKWI